VNCMKTGRRDHSAQWDLWSQFFFTF
jgi:hypothetical protein